MKENVGSQTRDRVSFSKIPSAFQIPNLIEIQRKSYDEFLQMDLMPSERKDTGLQAVFNSVFPITDYRDICTLQFVDYSIGNWQCKCGKLKGVSNLRVNCAKCNYKIVVDPRAGRDVVCPRCAHVNVDALTLCDACGTYVELNLKYTVAECKERGMTYAAPLKVTLRLAVYDKDPDTGAKTIRDVKEQEAYFGEIPLMTENGTFVINGTERVIVSQLHRSAGVFFHESGKNSFTAQIIPYYGSWVEFELDAKDLLYVRIDRKRKFLGTVFLRALIGYHKQQLLKKPVEPGTTKKAEKVENVAVTDGDIIPLFYPIDTVIREGDQLFIPVSERLIGMKVSRDLIDPQTREVLVAGGKKLNKSNLHEIESRNIGQIPINLDELEGAVFARDLVNEETGEVIATANQEYTKTIGEQILLHNIGSFDIFFPDRTEVGVVLSNTLKKDPIATADEAYKEIYRRLRPGDPPTTETSRTFFEDMFFNRKKYDFSRVGRLKLNTRLNLTTDLDEKLLSKDDYVAVISYLLKLRKNIGTIDDIDHLGNRRVRSVGELLQNQFRLGLLRMERAIKERMSVYQEIATAMPNDVINAKPVMAAIREFFGSSQLSQFMDQTNPISEITHKRRLSALGPGGLSRERAGFEVRDVHPTHYGRICPIETPEGPNIGLISSLSSFARINDFGFIESPYRKVKDGRIVDYARILHAGDSDLDVNEIVEQVEVKKTNESLKRSGKRMIHWEPYVFYLTAWEEDKYIIAQANAEVDEHGRLVQERMNARAAGDFILAHRDQIDFIDVSPKQLVSVAASLIPFLEHDDANRALMGSNMQRQAVPLIAPKAPIVGTGMEDIAAKDSGSVIRCQRGGVVDSLDSDRIIVRVDSDSDGRFMGDSGADIYEITKFKRSNQNTCINQKPIVVRGQRVKEGDILADGPCTDQGELALGQNVLVAFMPWRGYNFEDAIVISEKLVKTDAFTSIHIEEFETAARDTKLGPEDITRDIPNPDEDALAQLDESGIIRIGAYVKPGDILVGKITPKGESVLSPEEKLLRAIFGEKAGDFKDASLICPPGIEGIVVDVKIFTRRGQEKDEKTKAIEAEEMESLHRNLEDEIRILSDSVRNHLVALLDGYIVADDIEESNGRVLQKNSKITFNAIRDISIDKLRKLKVRPRKESVVEKMDDVFAKFDRRVEVLKAEYQEKLSRFEKGDDLPPGVIKLVKVYIAMKRKLSVGDKMAGRHGNKGVIAVILPEEDMPFLPDGTPVEIVLNPLGVPSRMNVGQILETHLGWAGKALGLRFSSPVFDGASEDEIKNLLKQGALPRDGKTILNDGISGEPFEQKITVGYIYMLKLAHLVDDKIHARSIGPYSLITQQPLGGKAQFGGQRFGEMEVWALEAYGASHTLQELLTAKSDDVYGRTKIYETIVRGEPFYEPGLPESFNVLVKELQSLALDVEMRVEQRSEDTSDVAAD
jgi:DNA-directed RNA polymerase subunit beta